MIKPTNKIRYLITAQVETNRLLSEILLIIGIQQQRKTINRNQLWISG